MGDHFTLDIHPHKLRAAAHSLDLVRQSLAKHAKTSTHEPAAIGSKWTGYAATSVTSEMTAVGGHLDTFASQLLHCSTALTTLAGHYEKAQATLTDLNTKWAKTETDYQSACDDADSAYDTSYDKLKGPHGAPPNRGLTSDLEDSRSSAKSSAYQAQQKAQGTLEADFATLKTHLTTQTETCGTALSTNIPVKNLGACTADNPTGLDHSNLLTDLTLVSEYEDLKQHNEDDQNAANAAAPEIKALQKALDDDDPEAIDAALKAIQDHMSGPYASDYSKAMIDALGTDAGSVAKAVNGLYNDIDWAIRKNEMNPYDQKDGILALTNALASGVHQFGDGDYAKFFGELSQMDQGAEQLALLASSGYSTSRETSAALALQSRWYHYPSGSRELFPEILQYAYDPPQDMVKILSARSDAYDLANLLEHIDDPDKLDYIFQSLTLVSRGDHDFTDDEANVQYDLLSRTIDVLKDDFIRTSDAEDPPARALAEALKYTSFWGSDNIRQRQDLDDRLLGDITSILHDGEFVRAYLNESIRDSGRTPKTLLSDLIHLTHADTKPLLDNLIAAELKHGTDPDQVATLIGTLLHDQDLGDMGLDWKGAGVKGVEEALSDALSKIAEENPITGFAYGPLKAILDDIGDQQAKIDDAYKSWTDAAAKDTAQHELALALYIKAHPSEAPQIGNQLHDYINDHHLTGDPSAVNRYYEHVLSTGGKTADELRKYADIINGTRDDE